MEGIFFIVQIKPPPHSEFKERFAASEESIPDVGMSQNTYQGRFGEELDGEVTSYGWRTKQSDKWFKEGKGGRVEWGFERVN